jgi:hypothetical protein
LEIQKRAKMSEREQKEYRKYFCSFWQRDRSDTCIIFYAQMLLDMVYRNS